MSALNSTFNNRFIKSVSKTIVRYRMLQPRDSVLLGVSGGPDSIALVNTLIHLSIRFPLNIGIAHLNHCLRGENSDNDEKFVSQVSQKLNIPFFTARKDVKKFQKQNKLSLEEAARRVRYDFFETTAKDQGYNKIALGHHADDNAELVLMYLLRGSGPLGLSGIRPVREDKYIRPLIHQNREEIMEYLKQNSLAYVTDMTNTDTKFLRNRIRHELIPALKKSYNPNISNTLNRLSSIIRDEEEWINETILPAYLNCVLNEKKDRVKLCIPELDKIPVPVKRRIIRKALENVKGNLRRITFSHIEDILKLLHTNKEADLKIRALDLPDRIRIKKIRETLIISKEKTDLRMLHFNTDLHNPKPYNYLIQEPGTMHIKEAGKILKLSVLEPPFTKDIIYKAQNHAFFDMDIVNFPITARNFKPGDRFRPMGISGTQKLKKFFINNKVPVNERNSCPILTCRDKIIWVSGYRIDDSVKITESTRKVLKAELLLA